MRQASQIAPAPDSTRKRVCIVAAVETTITAFLLDQLRALSARYDVTVVTNTQNPGFLADRGLDVEVVPVAIERRIAPHKDLAALGALIRCFRDRRFDAVHSVTPKAGLLSMMAASITRVPTRIHMFTGQVWATRRGMGRRVLKNADRVTARAATVVLADSGSQREFLVAEGVVAPERIHVLGAGSISGVDLERFRPDEAARKQVREELGIADDATVFLFLGRLNRDKGVLDLARAFALHAARDRRSILLVVGPDEEAMRPAMEAEIPPGRVAFVPFTPRPERFMAASDVLCLPSYREGFGSVIIEAAAVGVPAIGSRIYGVTDAIVEGVTGSLHTPGDVEQIAGLLDAMAGDPMKRRDLALAASARARTEFSKERVTRELLALYTQRVGDGQTRGADVEL